MAELLNIINKELNKRQLTLTDIINNNIVIGVRTAEEFYTFYDNIKKLTEDEIGISRDIWNIYMENDKGYKDPIMKEEGIMYIRIHGINYCGFCNGNWYKKFGDTLLLYNDCNIEYIYK